MQKRILLPLVVTLVAAVSCTPGLFDPVVTATLPASETPTPVPPEDPLEIAYINTDGKVWLFQEGIGPRPIMFDQQNALGVQISDDGEIVAYINALGELLAIDLTDGTPIQRTLIDSSYLSSLSGDSQPKAYIQDFKFIPNKPELILTIHLYDGVGGSDNFWVDAGHLHPVPSRLFAPGQGGTVTYSPDGNWFVISRPDELILSPESVVQARRIFDEYPPYVGLGSRNGPSVVWTEDASGFYTAAPIYNNNGELLGKSGIWWVPMPGDDQQLVFDYFAQLYHQAYISPLGQQVIFLTEYDNLVDLSIARRGFQQVFITYPKAAIGFVGWAPAPENGEEDSHCFVYWQDQPDQPTLVCDGISMSDLASRPVYDLRSIRWIDDDQFLYLSPLNGQYDLVLEQINQPGNTVAQVQVNARYPCYDYSKGK
jgi:hypothetical protein